MNDSPKFVFADNRKERMSPPLTESHQLQEPVLSELSVQYRLNLPIMVLSFTDNHQLAVTVPAGKIIQAIGRVNNDNRFLVADVGDEQFHIVASDVTDRARQVLSR